MFERDTIRELSATELDQVGGGTEFHPLPGPRSPEPLIPPIIVVSGPKPSGGPVVPPFPTPVTFSTP